MMKFNFFSILIIQVFAKMSVLPVAEDDGNLGEINKYENFNHYAKIGIDSDCSMSTDCFNCTLANCNWSDGYCYSTKDR